jgi:hypothetical protein
LQRLQNVPHDLKRRANFFWSVNVCFCIQSAEL